jgi:hypothetical protein
MVRFHACSLSPGCPAPAGRGDLTGVRIDFPDDRPSAGHDRVERGTAIGDHDVGEQSRRTCGRSSRHERAAHLPRRVVEGDLVPLEELIRQTPGAHPIKSIDELRSDAFETDEELDEFLTFITESPRWSQ